MLRGRGSLVGLMVALALCAALVLLHRQRERAHRPDPVVGAVRDRVLSPPQSLLLRGGLWWRGHVVAVGQGPRLARENAALLAQVQALGAQNRALQAAQGENDRLRRLLGFARRSPRPLLAAEVVALKPSPQADTLTLDRGSADGVREQAIVLSPDGALVGQVLDVTPRSCSVLLLTDAGAAAGAEVVRRGAPPPPNAKPPNATAPGGKPPNTGPPGSKPQDAPRIGICKGDRTSRLQVTFPRVDADVRPGDLVVTSGLGAVFPKGLPLGVVLKVSTDKARSLRTATLRPAADFDHLEEAFLIR